MFDMFDTWVWTTLTYGSDLRGTSKSGSVALDKVFLHIMSAVPLV